MTDAHENERTRREHDAAARAQGAASRARELRARLVRLQAGEPPSPDDVRDARLAVERALAAGILALEHAADAHARAAAAHRSAATLLDRVGRHKICRFVHILATAHNVGLWQDQNDAHYTKQGIGLTYCLYRKNG